MKEVALEIKNLSKQYRLGLVGTGTLSHDINRWWHRIRGKEDPYLQVGVDNNRAEEGGEYVWAIKDLNLQVNKGEVLGIIGKNGAGKSTLLKLLSQITGPTTGEINIDGKIATLLEVGTGFHPELTGKENIYLNGAILGMSKQEVSSKLDEIVQFSGCAKYIDTPVKRYSSGMKVRLGFAVAAHMDPDIMIIDEVLAVGDAEFQKKCIGKMQDVAETGRTILFVSHNMASVRNLCTSAIVMERGQIAFEGSTEDSIDYYLNSEKRKGIELRERSDRLGNGEIVFTDVEILDSKGKNIDQVFAGDQVTLRFHYDINKNFDPKQFLLSVVFYDSTEQIVTLFPSDEVPNNIQFPFENKNGVLDLHIPQLLLRPQEYDISIYSFLGGTAGENYVDTVKNAFSLTVLASDFYKTGKLVRNGNYSLMQAKYK